MSIKPTNITIKGDLIEVEYNGCQYGLKSSILTMISETEKIVWEYDGQANKIILNYEDKGVKFILSLDMIKSTIKEENISDKMYKEIIEKLKESKELDKKITDLKNLMDENKKKIEELEKEKKELNDQIDLLPIIIKYEYKRHLTLREILNLISKKKNEISAEDLISSLTSGEIQELIRNYIEKLEKLITKKIININLKNKEKKTLLEISMEKTYSNEYERFAVFLLNNDIDITPSIKEDIKKINLENRAEAYLKNAKRNGHMNLLKTLRNDIRCPRLQKLVDQS